MKQDSRVMTGDQQRIIERVLAERARQDEKWGTQNHWDTIWSLILGEEYGEIQKEILERECSWGEEAERHDERMEQELVQLVAVGISWLEARARRRRQNSTSEARKRRATAEALFGDDTMPVDGEPEGWICGTDADEDERGWA